MNKRKQLRSCFLCQTKDENRTYFRFPKDPERVKLWLQSCGIKMNSNTELIEMDIRKVLCEAHFSDDDIIRKRSEKGRTNLRANAIPIHFVDSNSATPSHQVIERECLTYVCKTSLSDTPVDENSPLQPKRRDVKNKCVNLRHNNDQFVEEVELPIPNLSLEPDAANVESDDVTINHSDPQSRVAIPNPSLEPEITIVEINDISMTHLDSPPDVAGQKPIIKDVEALIESFRLKFHAQAQCDLCERFITHLKAHTDIDVNSTGTSISPKTRSTLATPRKRHNRYVGDINASDLDTPEKARQAFLLAKEEVMKYRKRIDTLNKKMRRKDIKINEYKDLITHLQKKSLLREEAFFS